MPPLHTYLPSAMASKRPTKQGHQRELGTPSLAPALAHLPLAHQGNDVALLADHVDRPHAQHAVGVVVGDAVHENRHWQHRGAGCLHNWVVPIGTGQGAILAFLLEFERHCGGITQLLRHNLMHGHRWHIEHGAGEIMPLVPRHWEQVVKLPPFRMPEACVQVPLVVPAPSIRAQSQARNIPLKTCIRCPPKYGARDLGADGRDVPQREHGLHKPFCGLQIAVLVGR